MTIEIQIQATLTGEFAVEAGRPGVVGAAQAFAPDEAAAVEFAKGFAAGIAFLRPSVEVSIVR